MTGVEGLRANGNVQNRRARDTGALVRVPVRRDLRRQGGQPDEGRTADDDPLARRDVARDLHQTQLAITELDGASLETLAGHLDEDDRLSRIVDDGALGHRDRVGGRGHEDTQGHGLFRWRAGGPGRRARR